MLTAKTDSLATEVGSTFPISPKAEKKRKFPELVLPPTSVAAHAHASASSSSANTTATLLSRLFACPFSRDARDFLSSKVCTNTQRKTLAILAGLEAQWVNCDQKIPGNISDLADSIVSELYEPFWFYRASLALDGGQVVAGRRGRNVTSTAPKALFQRHMATRPLQQSKGQGFWVASCGVQPQAWLGCCSENTTFDAVVHVVQAGSGTGVHVGQGQVLTCAHVIDARDDEECEEAGIPPSRLGRRKVLMFPSGRTFLAECAAVVETCDGNKDVAALSLGAEINVSSLPVRQGGTNRDGGDSDVSAGALPFAELAKEAVELGGRLFCVGNPSNVNLESLRKGRIEFEPPCWHVSVGRCEGYVDPAIQAAKDMQAARGRAPTRGELKMIREAAPVTAEAGGYLQHSCWTYWGHSGAPLFNVEGYVTGLHCAWDDGNGMRHAQKLQHLHEAVQEAFESAPAAAATKKRKAKTTMK